MRVQFPDGTRITALGLYERDEQNSGRDYGLYFDPAWRPTWEADLIDWEDFGLPRDPDDAVSKIVDAFSRARSGQTVEIGCIGGIGRTGTALACMAVLAGVPVDEAVAWVRANYRSGAVETEEQARWVRWFAEQAGG
jgi:hypothetical protein